MTSIYFLAGTFQRVTATPRADTTPLTTDIGRFVIHYTSAHGGVEVVGGGGARSTTPYIDIKGGGGYVINYVFHHAKSTSFSSFSMKFAKNYTV